MKHSFSLSTAAAGPLPMFPRAGVAPRRIVVDATASLSGGKVYTNELLPRLVDLLPGTEWVVNGEITPELQPLLGRKGVKFRCLRFPQPTKSLLAAGVSKLLWREIRLPLDVMALRPCVLFTTANFASPLMRALHVPTVLGIHNLLPFHEPQWYREPNMVRRVRQRVLQGLTINSANRSARVIAFSGYSKHVLCERGVDPSKSVVVHHGIRPAERQWSGGESDTLLLISHYFSYKNIHVAIRALPRIQAATHRPLRLVVQGIPYDREYYNGLMLLVRKLGLEDCVFLGQGVPSAELGPLYASSRCLIFPAIGENCPITLLEAMSTGIPIAAARCRPLPEICGDAAIYYDTSDEIACADAVVEVLKSNETAQRLCDAGRKRAARVFTWDNCARKTAMALCAAWEEAY